MSLSGSPTGNATPRSQSPAAPTQASTSHPSFLKRFRTNKPEVQRMKETADVALSVAKTTADLLKDVTGNAGVPGLSEGFAVVSQILTKVKAMSATVKGIDELNKRLEMLRGKLAKFQSDSGDKQLPDTLQEEMSHMTKAWNETGEKLGLIKERNSFMRFLRSEIDADKLASMVKEISDTLQDSLTSAVWDIQMKVHQIQQQVDKLAAGQDDALLPRAAKNAQYNANAARNGCLDGTRRRFLDQLDAWVAAASARKATSGQILWVSALAGAGKTSIAFTVVEKYKAKGQMAANFFSARGDSECGNPNMVFTALAVQLCSFYPPLREIIAAVIRDDKTIVDAAPGRQLEELIVRPLAQVRDSFPSPAIIVIDALDECRDAISTSAISPIVSALSHSIDGLAPLLFILTSRREPYVTTLLDPLRGSSLSAVITRMDLHGTEHGSTSHDIEYYLTHELKEVPIPFHVPPDWLPKPKLDTLTSLSHDLFIFASTAVRFILDPKYKQPERRLERLLQMGASSDSAKLLDTLYGQVLVDARSGLPDDSNDPDCAKLENELRSIIGTIIVAEEPLSITAIAGLLRLAEYEVRNSLSGLHSVLFIPEGDSLPIRIIHPTFREFVLRSSPHKPDLFHLEPAEQHSAICTRCFDTMATHLRRDIARVGKPLLSKEEIPDLADKINKHIPFHLSYACRYWSTHLQYIDDRHGANQLFAALRDFLDRQLLFWLEVCGLLEVREGAIRAIDIARRMCKHLGEPLGSLVDTLDDYRRFAVKYSACIDNTPLQLYDSVLAATPNKSIVARKYGSSMQPSSLVVADWSAMTDWGPSIDSFASHRKDNWFGIFSVAFSPDGAFFATTGADQTIRIWRALTRTMVLVIEGLKDQVNSVAYSPDGANIVSGSKDGLVRTWDAVSGTHIRDLEGHSGKVVFVSYVADGTRIFSASDQGEIRLSDAADGGILIAYTSSQEGWDLSDVRVSPNGTMATYRERDTLYLHNLSTRQRETLDLPGRCWASIFSSDGERVAAATDAGIWIWSLSDNSLIRQLDIPQSPCCLTFSGDGAQIGCGFGDGSVRLWRLASERTPRIFRGHSTCINCLAWSPDGAMLVSVGRDGLLSVWDTAAPSIASSDPRRHPPSDRHPTGPARFGLFEYNGGQAVHDLSPSLEHNLPNDPGMPVIEGGPTAKLYSSRAAYFCDNLVEPSPEFPLQPSEPWAYPLFSWAYLIGRMHEHQTGRRSPIVFSPDGTLLAYVPSNNDIRVCDLRTRRVVATLTGHTDTVRSAAFSPNGALLASGAKDGTVNVWDASTGSLLSSYKQEGGVWDIVFSSDSRFVASCAGGQGVYVADTATGGIIRYFPIVSPENDMARLTFDFSGAHVLALDYENSSVYVWNISSGACVCHFLLRDNSWVTSLDFSPNDTGIILNSPDNAPCALTLWNPGDRRWPAYHVDKTGWIYAQGPGYSRRLGWLPQDWGFTLCSEGTFVYVWDRGRKVVVEIDLSRALQDAGLSVAQ